QGRLSEGPGAGGVQRLHPQAAGGARTDERPGVPSRGRGARATVAGRSTALAAVPRAGAPLKGPLCLAAGLLAACGTSSRSVAPRLPPARPEYAEALREAARLW